MSFGDYDVYYLSGYVMSFAVHGDGEPLLFYYESDELRAINVVIKRDIAYDKNFIGKLKFDTYFDFITPYGYGGWLIEGQADSGELFDIYGKWCKDNNIVSEFVRYSPVIGNHAASGAYYDTIRLGETVSMDLSTPEIIWSNMTSKNRNMVRKAEKSGITIKISDDKRIYDVFRNIYNGTMDRDEADKYYYFEPEFYEVLRNDLKNNIHVFYAQTDDGKIIAASLILYCNGRLHYHLSGSLSEYRTYAPTNLLLYKAALWGSENGCKLFHLGGGVGANRDSLFRFKCAFYKGEPNEYHIGKKVFDSEKYDYLLSLANVASKDDDSYFPQYRR